MQDACQWLMKHKLSLNNGAKTVMDIAKKLFEVGPRQPGDDSKIQVVVVDKDEGSRNKRLLCYASIRKSHCVHVLNNSLTLIAVALFLGSLLLAPSMLTLSLDEPGLMPLRSFVSISNAAVASWSRSMSIGLPSKAGWGSMLGEGDAEEIALPAETPVAAM